jgi:hypothetical protein
MEYRLVLKVKLVSLLTDGAKRGDKNFYVFVAYSAQKLYFIDLLNPESSESFIVTQDVAPIIQELNTYSIRVNYMVSDNASNMVCALNPNELTEIVQILSGEKVLHVRCRYHSANLALEGLSREDAAFLAFQNEMTLIRQILRREPIENPSRKEGVTSKILVIQDVKWNTCIQASDFIWKHHGTIQTVLEVVLKQIPFERWLPDYDMIRNTLSRSTRFIEIIEKDMVRLAVFYFHFCNVLKDLRIMTDNPYASQFANLLERYFPRRPIVCWQSWHISFHQMAVRPTTRRRLARCS